MDLDLIVVAIAAIVSVVSGAAIVGWHASRPKPPPPKLPPHPEPLVKVLRDEERKEADARAERHTGQYDEVKLDAAKPPAARDQAVSDWLNAPRRK